MKRKVSISSCQRWEEGECEESRYSHHIKNQRKTQPKLAGPIVSTNQKKEKMGRTEREGPKGVPIIMSTTQTSPSLRGGRGADGGGGR